MNGRLAFLAFAFWALWTAGCNLKEESSTPWIPVLEKTDFNYLESAVSRATKAVEEAMNSFQNGTKNESKAMQLARESLLELELYYVPMTKVRQLIYDADRLYYLGENDQMKTDLLEANKILTRITESRIYNLESSVNELILMIDELVLKLNESSPDVHKAFRKVGYRTNMMLVKGELIMSGQDFITERIE